MIIDGHGHYTTAPKALAVANHKQKVYIDLSGWSPKYFPNILIQYFNTLLKKKLLFGSDWPMISPDRWLADFEKIEIKDEVRPKARVRLESLAGVISHKVGLRRCLRCWLAVSFSQR